MLATESEQAVNTLQALGPFAAVVVVAWLLIRRSDNRDMGAADQLEQMRADYRFRHSELVATLDAERAARVAGEVDCARRIGELTGRIVELERRLRGGTP